GTLSTFADLQRIESGKIHTQNREHIRFPATAFLHSLVFGLEQYRAIAEGAQLDPRYVWQLTGTWHSDN
ncbi:MAG: hypothetical protein WBW41_10600, partial [Verrucomicrobiia bacterium]